MLASPAKEIIFPVFASPKIDGIRAYVKDGMLLSRSGKRIPNHYIQDLLGKDVLNGLDGELCVGPPNVQNLMQMTTSGVMSYDGQPDFTYWVFDVWSSTDSFDKRLLTLNANHISDYNYPSRLYDNGIIKFLEQPLIMDEKSLNIYEEKCLSEGYEGIMVRSPFGKYKFGRSTAKEGYLLKVKRWSDGEAEVLDFNEFMHNANELQQNEFGLAKRSSHQDNKVPMNTLGSLVCKDIVTGQLVDVGTGFTQAQRQEIWDNRKSLKGAIITYKHFSNAGVKDAPRFPVFVAFRHRDDIEAP